MFVRRTDRAGVFRPVGLDADRLPHEQRHPGIGEGGVGAGDDLHPFPRRLDLLFCRQTETQDGVAERLDRGQDRKIEPVLTDAQFVTDRGIRSSRGNEDQDLVG